MHRFLIPIIFLAAFAVVPVLGAYDITIEPVCTDPGDQNYPAISGNTIVWQDDRKMDYDIYMYDLSQPHAVPQPVSTAPGDQGYPAISGNTIVWQDDRNSVYSDIYMWDQVNGEQAVCPAASHIQYYPAISGDIIVWHDYTIMGGDIYMYDRSRIHPEPQPICTAPGDQGNPAISGNIVVWDDSRDSSSTGYDIYMWDPVNGEQAVCTALFWQGNPAISGNIVVWSDGRDPADFNIYMYDLYNSVLNGEPICTAPGDQDYPAISGNTIVWQDNRNYATTGYDIYMWDPVNGEQPVCTAPGDQEYPAISGDIIVWQDSRTKTTTGSDIYMATLTESTPPPEIDVTVDSFSVQGGAYAPGDPVTASAQVRNNGDTTSITVEYEVRNANGAIVPVFTETFAIPAKTSKTYSTELTWTVPQDAPAGDYDAMIRVYQAGKPENVYDSEILPDVFRVLRDQPLIEITVDSFSVQGGAYAPGDKVTASARVCNNADTDATIRAILGFLSQDGQLYKPFTEDSTIAAHSCVNFDSRLTWTVPANAAAGSYNAVFSIYSTTGNPPETLDTERINDALQITEHNPVPNPGDSGLLIFGLGIIFAVVIVVAAMYFRKQKQ